MAHAKIIRGSIYCDTVVDVYNRPSWKQAHLLLKGVVTYSAAIEYFEKSHCVNCYHGYWNMCIDQTDCEL